MRGFRGSERSLGIEEEQDFYDSRGGKAEIQEYIEERHRYEAVAYPAFEV
ncbi:MAG: hypothetical protein HFH92_17385 [Lachnospiraceae bacterium]|nr:hypothetical protein [uncultured Acetatifactor sp.]MCI8790827.1 hypothetical protein [Lachnospiraceae bacterium]